MDLWIPKSSPITYLRFLVSIENDDASSHVYGTLWASSNNITEFSKFMSKLSL